MTLARHTARFALYFLALLACHNGENQQRDRPDWRMYGKRTFSEFLVASGCEQCALLANNDAKATFTISSNIFGCADIDVLLPSLHWLYEDARRQSNRVPPGLLVDGGANVGRATARWIAAFGDGFGRRMSKNKTQAPCIICAGAGASHSGGGGDQPSVAVVAIEPSKSNYALLLNNAEANGWFDEGFLPLHAALGAVPGQAELAISEEFAIDEVATLLWSETDKRKRQAVSVITLSDVVEAGKRAFPELEASAEEIFLLKLDIEGLEPAVLRSLAGVDSPRTKFVSFEYAANVWQEPLGGVIKDLYALGFFCFLITQERLFPISGPFWDDLYELPMWSNVMCGHDGDPDLEGLVQLHSGAVGVWPRMPNSYLEGLAGDIEPQKLAIAQSRCNDLGEACGGVTCEIPSHLSENGVPTLCTPRQGFSGILRSPGEEVTYLRDPRNGELYLRYRLGFEGNRAR